MAGHSKWANIKHRKGAQDAKRAKVFSKIAKEIMVAASMGIPDPAANPALRLAVAKGRAQSMPKKNIDAAIAKAAGSKDGAGFKEIVYAGNISGVSFLVITLVDNENRIISNIQHYFKKFGGAVAGPSSVAYIFDRKGVLELDKSVGSEDEVMMIALDAGATDFEASDDSYFIYTDPSNFQEVKDGIEKAGFTEFKTAEVKYLPNQEAKIEKEKAEKVLEFIDLLEEDDDIQDVYHNLDADSFE